MKQTLAILRRRLAWAGVLATLAAPLTIGLAILGARSWGWEPVFALQTLTLTVAPLIALAGGVLGVIALVLVPVPPFGDGRKAVFAVLVAGAAIFLLVQARTTQAVAPPTHDVSTDWRDPLTFSPATMQARGPKANPVELDPKVDAFTKGPYAGMRVADVNAKTCPAALAMIEAETPAQAYAQAKKALTRAGLTLAHGDPAAGTLESTATSFWFRFKDDIVIRVRPEGPGARIDIRSISRSGVSDGGSNCAHLTRLRAALME